MVELLCRVELAQFLRGEEKFCGNKAKIFSIIILLAFHSTFCHFIIFEMQQNIRCGSYILSSCKEEHVLVNSKFFQTSYGAFAVQSDLWKNCSVLYNAMKLRLGNWLSFW